MRGMETNVYRLRALLVLFAAAVLAAIALLSVMAGTSGAAAGALRVSAWATPELRRTTTAIQKDAALRKVRLRKKGARKMFKLLLKTLGVMGILLSLTAIPAMAKENGPIVATDEQTQQILKIDPATGTVTPLNANGYAPTVTPDGKTLIFHKFSQVNENLFSTKLYTVPLDGSAEPAILPTTNTNPTEVEHLSEPAISPDSQTIYFRYFRSKSDGTEWFGGIASAPVNGGSITEIYNDPNDLYEGLSVTPDGQNLVWNGQQNIRTVSVNGGTSIDLMKRLSNSDTCDTSYFSPTVSPDGKTVAAAQTHYCEENNEPATVSIVTVPFSTTNTESPVTLPGTKVANWFESIYPAFSPDGQLISFIKQVNGKRAIMSVPATGGSASVIMPDTAGYYPRANEWAPKEAVVPQVTTTNPTDGATRVTKRIKPTVTFNTNLDQATVNDQSVKLEKYNRDKKIWVPVTSTPSYDAASKTITVTPSKMLDSRKKYRVVLSTDIKSSTDENLVQAFSFSFTTKR